ncbi:hypothetical protein BGX24_004015 [Mortierella sp. AD032]|nr:hypothetical protein BGX24_004015 [Mortierella sp. AD032]
MTVNNKPQQIDQRQLALQQFPCEERHSYNPHYQHNLVSLQTYSSPPSLCPSSTGSSPSFAYSSGSESSTSSFSRATGARALSQGQSNNSHVNKHQDHHYRHFNHRQSQRHYTYQQHSKHYHDDWMFGISEDDDDNGGASMSCAHPDDALVVVSSSSKPATSLNGSLRSSFSRRDRPQVSNGFLSAATSQTLTKKHRRPTVTFSPVVLHHPFEDQDFMASPLPSLSSSPVSSLASAPAKLLSNIVESSVSLNSSMAMATAKAESTTIIQQQQQPASAVRMTAKQSLMRIAQLSKDQDGWCSQKAGQYTQGYAEARSRGMKLDGRRTRRL